MREAFQPPPVRTKPPAGAPKDIAALTSSELRDRCVREYRKLQQHIDRLYVLRQPWQKGERERQSRAILTHLSKRYLPAVNALRDAADSDDLKILLTTLERRLEQGMDLKATPARDELWRRLLVERTVVEDALTRRVIARHMARIRGLE